jgi:hypothetical protein
VAGKVLARIPRTCHWRWYATASATLGAHQSTKVDIVGRVDDLLISVQNLVDANDEPGVSREYPF